MTRGNRVQGARLLGVLGGSALAISAALGQERPPAAAPPTTADIAAMVMKQAGDSVLGQKAALRWTLIERWAAMPDFEGTGPFPTTYSEQPGASAVVYQPRDPAAASRTRKLGVYVWGNGGCSGDSVKEARFHLTEIASHGYVALAPGKLLSGPRAPQMSGDERQKQASAPENRATVAKMTAALDWILEENQRPGSAFHGTIDANRVVIAGNSCGGLIALKAALDPRAKLLIMENSGLFPTNPGANAPAGIASISDKADLDRLHTPVLYLLGGPQDQAQPNGLDDFNRITKVPVFVADQPGAGHIGLFMEPRGESTKIELDWLKWQFDKDRIAARTFVGADCTLCTDYRWQVHRKKIR